MGEKMETEVCGHLDLTEGLGWKVWRGLGTWELYSL